MEQLDEDLAVTQTQVNLICPLTQVDHFSLLMSLSLCSNSFPDEQLYLIFNVCLIFNVALSYSNNALVLSWKW